MSDKLKQLPGGGNKDKFKELVRTLKSGLDDYLEYHTLLAKIQRAKYNALIDEGFTPEQALELCKSI